MRFTKDILHYYSNLKQKTVQNTQHKNRDVTTTTRLKLGLTRHSTTAAAAATATTTAATTTTTTTTTTTIQSDYSLVRHIQWLDERQSIQKSQPMTTSLGNA